MPQVPPGRMGRLWVLGRLELAERGVSLLEEKLRLLGNQRDRCSVARTRPVGFGATRAERQTSGNCAHHC